MKKCTYVNNAKVKREERNAMFIMEIDDRRYSFSVQPFFTDNNLDRSHKEQVQWLKDAIGRQFTEVAERARELGRQDVRDAMTHAIN